MNFLRHLNLYFGFKGKKFFDDFMNNSTDVSKIKISSFNYLNIRNFEIFKYSTIGCSEFCLPSTFPITYFFVTLFKSIQVLNYIFIVFNKMC